MFSTRSGTANVDAAVARGIDYEVTLADLSRRSERRAWVVAITSTGITLMLAVGCFAMLPLKERVPFLVMADASSGTASIARMDENFRHRSITASEAINRANIAQFVTLREAYDLELINLHDWRTVHSMATPEVGRAYSALHSKRNPDSPYNTYGSSAAIRTRILSIALIEGSPGNITGATVRFQRSLYDKRNGAQEPLDNKIATMAFEYDLSLKMDERDRLQNPLGFQVTSYRAENDYAALPPMSHDVSPRPALTEATVAVQSGPADDRRVAVDAASASAVMGPPVSLRAEGSFEAGPGTPRGESVARPVQGGRP